MGSHHHEHHKREYIFLASFLLIFGIVFFLGVINLRRGVPLFGVIDSYEIENWTVIILSFFAIVKAFIEILRF